MRGRPRLVVYNRSGGMTALSSSALCSMLGSAFKRDGRNTLVVTKCMMKKSRRGLRPSLSEPASRAVVRKISSSIFSSISPCPRETSMFHRLLSRTISSLLPFLPTAKIRCMNEASGLYGITGRMVSES